MTTHRTHRKSNAVPATRHGALRLAGLAVLAAVAFPVSAQAPKDQAAKQANAPATGLQVRHGLQVELPKPLEGRTGTGTGGAQADGKGKDAPPAGGPTGPDLPGLPTGRRDVTTGERTAKDDVSGTVVGDTALRDAATGKLDTSRTARPGFDQGFNDRKVSEADAEAARGGNPVGRLTGGSVVRGPLGDAASKGGNRQPGRSGAVESGLVGDGQGNAGTTSSACATMGAGGVSANCNSAGARDALRNQGFDPDRTAGAFTGTNTGTTRGDALKQAIDEIDGRQAATPSTPAGTPGTETTRFPSGNTTETTRDKDGNVTQTVHTTFDPQHRPVETTTVVHNPDGTKTVTKSTTTYANEDDNRGTTTTGTPTQASSCPPDLDGCNSRPSDRDIARRLNDPNYRIVQGAKAGGNVNPDRNDDSTTQATPGVVAATHGQNRLGLLGQPGGPGTQEVSGGNGGLDFNNRNLGAVDPGRDSVITAGSHRDHNRADDALRGGTPSPTAPITPVGGAETEDDDEDDGEAATSGTGSGG